MTTYLQITSDKPTELTAFVGPKKPVKKDILNNDEFVFVTDFGEWIKAMETAKASRLPVVNAEEIVNTQTRPDGHTSGIRYFHHPDQFGQPYIMLDTPVELEGWEPEIVYQVRSTVPCDDDFKDWVTCKIGEHSFKTMETRQAYRMKRSEQKSGNKCDKCGCKIDLGITCGRCTLLESPIEAKTQDRRITLAANVISFLATYIHGINNGKTTNLSKLDILNAIDHFEKLKQIEPESHKTQESQILTHKEEILRFLLGEGKLDGYSFGDRPFDKGAYWWRIQLRKAFNDILTRRNP